MGSKYPVLPPTKVIKVLQKIWIQICKPKRQSYEILRWQIRRSLADCRRPRLYNITQLVFYIIQRS